MTHYSIGLIGPGRLGRALLTGLREAGHSLAAVVLREGTSAEKLREDFPEAALLTSVTQLPPVDVLFLTVPDDAILDVVRTLRKDAPNLSRVVVAHTSGAKSSALLSPLREIGALVASFHPAQSFAGLPEDSRKFRGATVAIEGDAGAVAVLTGVARDLGGNSLEISTEAKPLYHLACVMASNYSTALLDAGLDVLEKIGISRPKGKVILLPLLQTTATNLKTGDPEEILTGPIARGDVQTVREHLQQLAEKNPRRLATYIALGRETLGLARRLALRNEAKYREIEKLFAEFESTGNAKK